MQRVELQLQQLLLLVRQLGDPRVLVELGRGGRRRRVGIFLGGPEEGGYAAVGFGLFGRVRGCAGGFALEGHGCGGDFSLVGGDCGEVGRELELWRRGLEVMGIWK